MYVEIEGERKKWNKREEPYLLPLPENGILLHEYVHEVLRSIKYSAKKYQKDQRQ